MKTCIDCNETKALSEFVPKASYAGGYEHRCRVCRSIKYNKSTPELLAKKLFNTQTLNSVKRGHGAPSYTLEAFTTWLKSHSKFAQLFSDWQVSGYKKDLAPSVDRVDNSLGYDFNNLDLMTWGENRALGAKSKLDGDLNSGHKPVAAYNKDGSLYMEFISVAAALRHLGIKTTQSWGLVTVANGLPVKDGKGHLYTPKSYKGFVWKWI